MKSKPFIILVVLSIILPLMFFYLVHDDKPEVVKLEASCKDIKAQEFEKKFHDGLNKHQKKIVKPDAQNDWLEFIEWHNFMTPCLNGDYAEAMNGAWINGLIFGMDDFLKLYSNHPLKKTLLSLFLNFYHNESATRDSFQNSCSQNPSPTCEELMVSIAELTPEEVSKK